MKRIISFIISMLLILSTMPTTIAFADSAVTFTDTILQDYMCNWVGKAPGSTIYLSDITSHSGSPIYIPKNVTTLAGMENLAGLTVPQIIIQQGTISDLTPIKDIKGVINLSILDNNVSDITPLSNYTSLEQVQITNNKISIIAAISNWTAIKNLDLSFNNISNISSLSGLTTLEYLKLRHNNISNITALSGLTALFQLDIEENNISSLAAVTNLTNMQSLSIDHNQISNITPVQGMSNLDYLSISDNPITDLSPLNSITKVTILYANRNGFSSIDPLKHSTKLQILQVDGNQVSDISPLAGVTTLQELSVDSNKISDITPVKDLTNLKTFWAWGNEITDISSIANLTGLQELHLMNNKITDISAINNLVNLKMLILAYNRITDFTPITHINNINQYIYLNDNYSNIFSGAVKAYIDGVSVLKVTTPQHKLLVNKNSFNLSEGSTDILQYNIQDTTDGTFSTPGYYLPISSGSNIVLTSSDPSIATVDQDGNIKAVSIGSTTITAELFGINAEYTRQDITVNVAAVPKGSVTIKYQDENGTDLQAPDVLSNLSYGTYTENAKSFPGYELNDSSSKDVTIDSTSPNQTIIFNYKTVKGSVTVKYQDENGTDLQAPNVLKDLSLGTYAENAKSFPGYELNDSSSKSVTLTDSNPNQTIIFNYKTVKGSVTVKYQDENGTDLQAPNVLNDLSLGIYAENAKSFLGYELNDSNSKSVTLTDSNPNQTIIFIYKAIKGSITVKYQDEDGKDIITPDIINNLNLGTYAKNAKSFPGYELNDSSTKSVSLIDSNSNQIIIFKYKKDIVPLVIKGSYTVKYKDQDGNILEQETTPNIDLGSYTVGAKSFEGYILNDDNSKTVLLTKDNPNKTIVFNYKKKEEPKPAIKGSIIVKYQDEDGKDITAPEELTDLELGNYTEKAKSFKGYRLDGADSQSVILTEDKKEQIIVFKYKKEESTVIFELPQTGGIIGYTMITIIGLIMIMLGVVIKKAKFNRSK